MDNDLALLHQKIDTLTEQFDTLCKRQEEMKELQHDLVPIFNHMFKLSIDELAEIGRDFELEDLLFLLKRLLRDTHLLLKMLDQLEGLADFGEDTALLVKPMFANAVEELNTLEQKGYFAFARGLWYVAERIATEFSEEDVRELGDNVVTILNTVRNMTQPEVMTLANNAIGQLDEPMDEKISMWRLLREMNNPQARRGMARLLNIVKSLDTQTEQSVSV